jgi:hypothetical protein
MKNRKRFYRPAAILLISTFMFLLSGCQLAQETMYTEKGTDELCGVFVVLGYKNIIDCEDKLLDNNTKVEMDSNGNLTFKQPNFPYTVEGKPSEDATTIYFDGLTGYYFGVHVDQDESGNDTNYISGDNGFRDVNIAVNDTDGERSSVNEATICIKSGFTDSVYVNPVYQRPDGSYYTTIGEGGLGFSGITTGCIFTKTFDTALTNTANGIKTSEKTSYKVNINVVDEANQIFIKEMNQKDELIKTTEYFAGDPDKFVLDSNTEYVIVEEQMKDSAGKTYLKRSVESLGIKDLSNEAVSHNCNFADDSGVVGLKTIEFTKE